MSSSKPDPAPHHRIGALGDAALQVARKAKKHRKSLTGANFYADRLAQLRTDATNAFSELLNPSVGDVSAIAELMQACFSPATSATDRATAVRELVQQIAFSGAAWAGATLGCIRGPARHRPFGPGTGVGRVEP